MPISRIRVMLAVILMSAAAFCGSVKTDAAEKDSIKETIDLLTETIEALREEATYLRKEIRSVQEDRDKCFAHMVELTELVNRLSAELAKERARVRELEMDRLPLERIPAVDVEGLIAATSEKALVEISLGSDDGLARGQRLRVFRGEASSPVHLGEIEVVKTDPDRSICRIISDSTASPIGKGDRVTTKVDSAAPKRRIVKRESISVQVRFARPTGMQVFVNQGEDGGRETTPLTVPAKHNFRPGRYDLKLAAIPGRSGVQLHPSLEIPQPGSEATEFLDHTQVPIQFTEEDLDQVLAGNLVTKVVFLPDPEFQELALAGVETLVSIRVDPGVDPIKEADRRGAILAIVRLGNKEKEPPRPRKRSVISKRDAGSEQSPRVRAESTDVRASQAQVAELVNYTNSQTHYGGVSAQAAVSYVTE